jgi:hypothetical protein
MKIKKIAYLLILILSIGIGSNAQKVLSGVAIKDFSNSCEFQVRFNQDNNYTLSILMQHIRGIKVGTIDKAFADLTSTETDKKAREIVFEAFNSLSGGDPDRLYNLLFNWGLSSANAREISSYISTKYAVGEEAPERAENALFTGTKKFTDGSWNYVVTIKQDSITLKLYPSATNTYQKNKTKAQAVVKGTVKEGQIATSSDRSYKIEKGNLYELNNEGGWNEYKEVSIKK